MTGTPALTGWGHQAFGDFPFGSSDWSDEGLIRSVPEFYRNDDENPGGRWVLPLLNVLAALKPLLNELEEKTRIFPTLTQADDCPIEQLWLLASTVGVDLSRDKPEAFQRLEILNNPQMILRKGTDKGYQIAGSFDGLTAEVVPLWADRCDPDSPLTVEGPDAWMPSFDELPADVEPLDVVYADRFDLWPTALYPIANPEGIFFDVLPLDALPLDANYSIREGRCRTYKLRLYYAKPDDTEIEDYTNVSRRVKGYVERFRPLHVEIETLIFDGPKAAVTWVESVKADAFAAVSWSTAKISAPLASVQWVMDVSV